MKMSDAEERLSAMIHAAACVAAEWDSCPPVTAGALSKWADRARTLEDENERLRTELEECKEELDDRPYWGRTDGI